MGGPGREAVAVVCVGVIKLVKPAQIHKEQGQYSVIESCKRSASQERRRILRARGNDKIDASRQRAEVRDLSVL